MIRNIRRPCIIKDCPRLGRNKGHWKGHTIYDRFCEIHHRLKLGKNPFSSFNIKKDILNNKCEECGWDKASCDRHRIDPKQGYYRENVKVLCPNCHRLAHVNFRRVKINPL